MTQIIGRRKLSMELSLFSKHSGPTLFFAPNCSSFEEST